MGDLMDRLRDEAAAVDPQLARSLTEAGRSNPAREIEQAMQQSARDAEAGQPSAATAKRSRRDAQARRAGPRPRVGPPAAGPAAARPLPCPGETGCQGSGADQLGDGRRPAGAGRARSLGPGPQPRRVSLRRKTRCARPWTGSTGHLHPGPIATGGRTTPRRPRAPASSSRRATLPTACTRCSSRSSRRSSSSCSIKH